QAAVAVAVSSQTPPCARQHFPRAVRVAARAMLERDRDLDQPLQEAALVPLDLEPQLLEDFVRREEPPRVEARHELQEPRVATQRPRRPLVLAHPRKTPVTRASARRGAPPASVSRFRGTA